MKVKVKEHASLGALRVWVFGFLLIEISSRKAVPEVWYGMVEVCEGAPVAVSGCVTSTFPGPLH